MSEQSASFVLLLALCWPVSHAVTQYLPGVLATEPQKQCQRQYKYQGRNDEGRPTFEYKKRCWNEGP